MGTPVVSTRTVRSHVAQPQHVRGRERHVAFLIPTSMASTLARAYHPGEYLAQTIKQASVSLTLGVFIGSAVTSGLAAGLTAALLANNSRLRHKVLEAASAFFRGLPLASIGLQPAEAAIEPSTAPIDAFNDHRLAWAAENGAPGAAGGGAWRVEDEGRALVIAPAPGLDHWCRTFYTPLLVKHDGQALCATVSASVEASLITGFTLRAEQQFDQAGVMVLVDGNTWCKAGIEFVDGLPRLACVVTNDGYSDWSTAPWAGWDAATRSVSAAVRITKLAPGAKQGGCLVFEAAAYDAKGGTPLWKQVRIASLRAGDRPWRMGVYACSPIKQSGCEARFHHVSLGPKAEPVHEAALPKDHGGL